ncbi:hypothetical protein BME18_05465 [Klebsiella michiganensis]|uniref:3'-5' exonuclease n=1 Tax=Klebsiella pasteurii TaxID=2587529 RepID=UPI000B4136EE|nr:3'-5' exonuclease [Klebsiella pasteurii]MDX7158910.1 3'-5' exonuclease [Klebsiella pasteurii]OVU39936.1 hypothetical protein BME18_05465 [Klebsiella michiganensis]
MMDGFIIVLVVIAVWWLWTLKKDYKQTADRLRMEIKSLESQLTDCLENNCSISNNEINFIFEKFVVVDVETTGLKAATSNIIQIAIIVYEKRKQVAKIVEYINPGVPIPEDAIKVNNITNEKVASAHSFSHHAYNIEYWLTKYKVVGHNLRFDARMIEAEFQRINKDLQINWGFCTMSGETRRPDLDSRPTTFIKLIDLAQNLKLKKKGNLHDAYVDAELTGRIAIKIAEKHLEKDVNSLKNSLYHKRFQLDEIENYWLYRL